MIPCRKIVVIVCTANTRVVSKPVLDDPLTVKSYFNRPIILEPLHRATLLLPLHWLNNIILNACENSHCPFPSIFIRNDTKFIAYN